MNVYKYVMGRSKEGGTRPFSVLSSDRTRGNGHEVQEI